MKQQKKTPEVKDKDKDQKKGKPKTPLDDKDKRNSAQDKNKKNPKGKNEKNIPPEEEEEVLPPPEKEKNLERFIYVTTYSDSTAMQKIKEIFEEINQPAFQLRSVREIYTKNLTEEERDNNEIDYISGCQIIDKEIRITIIEGITGKGMEIVKQKLPKYQMNTKTFKVFADSNILFNKRIYSKFDLSLKYIKLRDTLNNILTTFDIYSKANKYREIYNAFLNYGSILKSETMREIANANLFPDADSLLLLERKYADILNEEDMTGIHMVKKAKKRIRAESLLDKTSNLNSSVYSGQSDNTKDKIIVKKEDEAEKTKDTEKKKEKIINKEKLDSRNLEYIEFMKNLENNKLSVRQTILKNKKYLQTMKRKPNPDGHFCRPFNECTSDEDIHFYSPIKNNYYVSLIDRMGSQYINDKDHYYTYSKAALTLSFPLVINKNLEYLEYLDNKKKWITEKNFDRYTQPAREKVFFPKINNVL